MLRKLYELYAHGHHSTSALQLNFIAIVTIIIRSNIL